MPLKFNQELGQFEQVATYDPDPAQLEHLRAELKRLEARQQEIQAQIDQTGQEQIQANATLMNLKGNTELEGIDERVSQILTLERKLELLESRRRALDSLLSTCKEQIKPLYPQILGYQDAITRENNSQAIENFLPTFLEAQEAFLESRGQLRELILQSNNFSTWKLEWFSKIEVLENRIFKFTTIK